MASEDVIELGSSDEEAEPAPKKKKPMPDAMVVIPNKQLPGLTIKQSQCNVRRQNNLLSRPITINKNIHRRRQIPGPIQMPNKYHSTSKITKIPIPTQNRFINPLSFAKNLINSQVPKPKLQTQPGLTKKIERKGSKILNNLPPGITIKLVQNADASEVTKNKISTPQNSVGDILTVEIDDEEITESSTSSPQWYIRPEDQIDDNAKKESITQDMVQNKEPSIEEQNNKEPEGLKYVEITIEDSPLKPLPQKHNSEIGNESAIIIEDSPAKIPSQNTKNVSSDCEGDNKKDPESKKKLLYPKESNDERQIVEIEIDFNDISEFAVKENCDKDSQKCQETLSKDDRCEIDSKMECDDTKTTVEEGFQTKENVEVNNGEFHPIYQNFIDTCFKLENSEDMNKIVEKKIKAYYKQCPTEYVESKKFIDMVSSKIVSMTAAPDKMYLFIKDIVDELNLQRKMAKSIVFIKDDTQQGSLKTSPAFYDDEFDIKKRRQIRKLEKTINKLHRAIQKLEEQEIDFDDEEDSVYILVERYKERMVRVHKKFCQLTNTKMPSEPRISVESRPGRPTGPAKRLEKWINKKVPIGTPLPFPDFHDVLRCVRDANNEDKLGWNEYDMMEEARDLFARCGKKLQKRRQENEWRLAASRITQDVDPAEENMILKKKLEENKVLSISKENELFNRFADKQNQLKLVAVEIGDKEAEESPLESDEEEEEVESKYSAEDKQKRKEKIKKLLQEKTKPISEKENDIKPVKVAEDYEDKSAEKEFCINSEDKSADTEEQLKVDTGENDQNTTEPNSNTRESNEHTIKPDLEVPTGNLESEIKVNSIEENKEIADEKEHADADEKEHAEEDKSYSDNIESDVDELHLHRKCREDEVKLIVGTSDSDFPISISDTESESESEIDKKMSDSYSESDSTSKKLTSNYSKTYDDSVNENFEVEHSSLGLIEEFEKEESSMDGEEEVALISDTCINLKDDNISISETTVEGLEDILMNNKTNASPDNNNELMVLDNSNNSEDDIIIQECSKEYESELLKNQGTDSNESPKEAVDMENISDGKSDELACVEMQTDVNKDEVQTENLNHLVAQESIDSSSESRLAESLTLS